MIDKVVKKLPQAKVVATTLREVHSTNHHSWSAVAWIDGKTYTAPTAELEVVDRVGGGDGFAAGFIYGLLTGETPEEALRLDGRMARCSPPSPATQPWQPWIRCEPLPKADRRAFNGNIYFRRIQEIVCQMHRVILA